MGLDYEYTGLTRPEIVKSKKEFMVIQSFRLTKRQLNTIDKLITEGYFDNRSEFIRYSVTRILESYPEYFDIPV